LKIAFAGSFAVRSIEPAREQMTIPCEIVSESAARTARGDNPINAIVFAD
jgi:hypothetical protein